MKFVFCNLYQQSQVKWIEFPDGGVTRGGHGERDVEAAEELLKRGLNFVNDDNYSDNIKVLLKRELKVLNNRRQQHF